jgi:hypothetical protein
MLSGIGDDPAADDPVLPVDGKVGLVAVDGDGDIDRSRSINARFRLGILDRPAPIGVLLGRLGGLVRPNLLSGFPRLDGVLFGFGIALIRRGDQACVDDLTRARDETGLVDRAVEFVEQRIERVRGDRRRAEIPECARIRRRGCVSKVVEIPWQRAPSM